MNKIKEFNENGFCIAKSIIPVALHKELFLTFYDLVTSMVNRHKVQLDFDFKDISDVKYPDDIDHLDKALFAVSDYKRDLIGELYDTIAYCSAFLKFVSHPEIENNDLVTFNGDLKVGKSILNETFSSHVSYYKEKDKSIETKMKRSTLAGSLRFNKNCPSPTKEKVTII